MKFGGLMVRSPAFHTEIWGSIPLSGSFVFFSSFSKKGQCLRPCTAFQRRIAKIGPSSNESLKYREFAIVKFESGPWCSHLQKCISFYLVAYYSQRSLQFEIPHFQSLSWPSEAIKILFANFNHLIMAKALLALNMRIIQNFVSWG